MNNKELASELRSIMFEKNITQLMLSQKTGLTTVWINNILSGKVNINQKTIALFERELDIKIKFSFTIEKL